MKERGYSVQDLINCRSFNSFVKGTANNKEIEFWDEWIEEKEQNRVKAKKAMLEITGFQFSIQHKPNIDKEWSKLLKSTIEKNKEVDFHRRKRQRFSGLKWIYRIAAVLVFGALIGGGFYSYFSGGDSSTQVDHITKEKTVLTDTDEQKTIHFSNGSKIILNSNSEVIYSTLQDQSTVEVVLDGEAYFDAVGGKTNEPVFVVNTPDGLIKDIGTKFAVSVEHDISRVVLEEGRVQVSRKTQNRTEQITIQTDEMLEFSKSGILNRQQVNSSFYTSWATGSIRFNDTSIRKFIEFVEDRYNKTVTLRKGELGDIKIDGGIYYRSLAELVRSVSDVADFSIYQSEDKDTIYIGGSNKKE